MSEQQNDRDVQKALFLNLIMMFSSAAMQYMGKLVDPTSGKATVNLEAAQFNIDLLTMLRAKAAGNLDPQEDAYLNSTLTSLQLTYVETAREQPAAQGSTEGGVKPAAPEVAEPAQPPPAGTEQPAAGTEKAPKFRKSYG